MFMFKFYKTYYCVSLDNIDMIWSDVYKWQSEMAFLGKQNEGVDDHVFILLMDAYGRAWVKHESP